MRIAVTGTHGCGKTTLIDDFISAYGKYESVPEPYWLLAQNGIPFADGPTTADLEEQLGQSCLLILEQAKGADVIFDRCPLDFLAYLDVVSESEGFEWLPQGRLLGRIAKALASLDLVVFVPLLSPDEIGGDDRIFAVARQGGSTAQDNAATGRFGAAGRGTAANCRNFQFACATIGVPCIPARMRPFVAVPSASLRCRWRMSVFGARLWSCRTPFLTLREPLLYWNI